MTGPDAVGPGPGGPDRRVWRALGDPLVPATGDGPLRGVRIAVKDLIDVAGHRVGAGSPAWLAEAEPATAHAPALAALLVAGAEVRGIAATDELAYSIAGANDHYGTPPNPARPGSLPGGSSSGPASAVALGDADLGLGTDTAGSLRVPAAYQGLWGLRPTTGAVPSAGVLPLAPSFDTVGWLARDDAALRAAAAVGLAPGRGRAPVDGSLVVLPVLVAAAGPAARAGFERALTRLRDADVPVSTPAGPFTADDLVALFAAFRAVQGAEAHRAHGAWVLAHPGALGPAIAARFAAAALVSAADERAGRAVLADAAARLDALLGDGGVLALPTTASPAPAVDADPALVDAERTATLTLTCLASATGRPALSAPAGGPGPVGLSLMGPRDADLALLDLAGRCRLPR